VKQALGLVEVSGLSTAIVTADTMVKAANIKILGIENTKGLGYITIKAVGDVGAVTAAVQAGRQMAMMTDKLVSWKVIPRPADYVETVFCKTESTKPAQVETVEASVEAPVEEVQVETVAEPEADVQTEAAAEPEADTQPEAKTDTEPKSEPEPAKKPGTSRRKK